MFCMNCGQQLPDGAKFCFKCGTPQGAVSTTGTTQAKTVNLDRTHTFVPAMCPNCSAHMQVDSSSKIARCESCGTECLVQDAIKTLNVRGNIQVGNATINVNGTNTESLLQRVEIMLASGDFDGAISKCDTVLDSDPTNAEVYVLMLMASLECRNRSDLAMQNEPFDNNPYFNNAIQYGDDNLRDELLGYLNSAIERYKAEIAEWIAQYEAQLRSLEKDDVFDFGTYNGLHISWKVLKISRQKALIVTCNKLCDKPYHQLGGAVTWEACTLRQWLNNDFYNNSFAPFEKNRILAYSSQNAPEDPSDEKVSLLSLHDMTRYFYNVNERATGYWWWLKSSSKTARHSIVVRDDGMVPYEGIFSNEINTNANIGVRPAMWIKLD